MPILIQQIGPTPTIVEKEIRLVTVGIPGPSGGGIPLGGSGGDVLHKRSNADGDFEWAPITAGELPQITAVATVSQSEPLTGIQGELWFKDDAQVLRVYANDEWQTQTMDDGFY